MSPAASSTAGALVPATGTAGRSIRAGRVAALTVTGLFLLALAWKLQMVFATYASYPGLGFDFDVHRAVAQQWLARGQLYAPIQLAGPYSDATVYTADGVVNLYPPPMVLLFAPFTILPALLWWVIPLGILAAMTIRWRPAVWSWPVTAAALLVLPFAIVLAVGNTTLWAMAAVALATRWPGVAVTLAAKPLMAPFIVLFLRRSRSWLIAIAATVVVGVLFLPWWADYVTSVRNLVAGVGVLESLIYHFPAPLLAVVPLIPWMARTRGRVAPQPSNG